MTEPLYLNGIRGTLYLDAEAGVWTVAIIGHERFLEARTYDLAMAAWELAVAEITGQG
jgi:hypothetical protein